jgi:hypothetical protein
MLELEGKLNKMDDKVKVTMNKKEEERQKKIQL